MTNYIDNEDYPDGVAVSDDEMIERMEKEIEDLQEEILQAKHMIVLCERNKRLKRELQRDKQE